MGKMIDNVRAFWNDLGDKFTDPEKMANLKVADLEKAIKKAKEQAAVVVGRPVAIRQQVKKLEGLEADYTDKIKALAAAAKSGDEQAKELATKYATKLGTIRTDLANEKGELEEAEVASKEWADKIAVLERALEQKRGTAQKIAARSGIADAETALGKTMGSLDGIMNGSDFDGLEAKVRAKEQKAAGMSQMNGLNDAIAEKSILEKAAANDILSEFGL